jgi:hypothetical protein
LSEPSAPVDSRTATLDTTLPPPLDPAHKSTTEIQNLLAKTGEVGKDGVLIDFHDDLRKNLPAAEPSKADGQ